MGLTIVDADFLIGFFDGNDAHHLGAKREFSNARHRGDQIAVRASALAEALVSPARAGESSVAAIRGEFIERLPLMVAELDSETAVMAARLRARHGQKLKLPDALVIATAIRKEASVLVTTDRRWPTKSKLGFEGNLIRL